MAGAKLIRTYTQDGEKCSVYKKKGSDEKTICWPIKENVINRFKRNGQNCRIMEQFGRRWMKCSKPWEFGKLPTFNFKGARKVRDFIRQGQKCETWERGENKYTKCTWSGFWEGAKVVKRFDQFGKRCTLWQKED